MKQDKLPPQYAVSYLQIKKCYSIWCVGQALIGKLLTKLKVYYSAWVSSEVSVQHLADRNSLYQKDTVILP
ncbi:hypothetical protein RCA_04370 [Rickettsia canadensis str. CA410]|uniref:Uncharacterized protein n=1 Tax=Rickettsia canadensis str. CA410 TaxID=1105107 RepID=A0ABM5MTD3_RICCA|nr:hypothetical protein RCA_04370 [Rickettsia canadensis str. CA410]